MMAEGRGVLGRKMWAGKMGAGKMGAGKMAGRPHPSTVQDARRIGRP
jgi:hypothetical protein